MRQGRACVCPCGPCTEINIDKSQEKRWLGSAGPEMFMFVRFILKCNQWKI